MIGAAAGTASELLSSLQRTLAGEHAAVWAGGRAAARLSGSDRSAALADLETSRSARDKLVGMVLANGGQPVPAAAAYEQSVEVTDADTARELLARVSLALCPLYADLAGASDPADRPWPLRRCRENGLAGLSWGAQSQAFPGAVSEPAQSEPAQSEPAQSEPAQSEPAEIRTS